MEKQIRKNGFLNRTDCAPYWVKGSVVQDKEGNNYVRIEIDFGEDRETAKRTLHRMIR